MRHVRRSAPEVRLELAPLLDVVFLLLTFFVFSIVLMVRADTLDVRLPELTAGSRASGVQAITIAIDAEGRTYVDGEATPVEGVPEAVRALRASRGEEAALLVAVDERGSAGDLLRLTNVLSGAGLGEFSVLGRSGGSGEGEPVGGGEP